MTPRSLFLIVLKCLGIFFIKEFILILGQFLMMLFFLMLGDMGGENVWTFIVTLASSLICFIIIWALLFKTEFILRKLQLERGFDEDPFTFHVHRSSVLSIVIMISGLLIIIDAVPKLCRELITYSRENSLRGLFRDPPDLANIIVTITQILIGLLLIGNQRQIVNFMERKRRKTGIQIDS
ncbi:MAG TPA: hypothetical protein VGI82_03395 [Chitinophagaceae bacterium]|jgi:hypothetical protein